MRSNIERLLFESRVSANKISKDTGIPATTIRDYRNGIIEIDNMALKRAEILSKYYEEVIALNNTWTVKGHKVELVDFDHDLKQIVVSKDGEVKHTITPPTLNDMYDMIQALNKGDDMQYWIDDNDNYINLK